MDHASWITRATFFEIAVYSETSGCNINFLLTERKGCTGEYWSEVEAVRTERSEVRTKTTEGLYSPIRLELASLVSSLLYDTRARLVFNSNRAIVARNDVLLIQIAVRDPTVNMCYASVEILS